MDYCVRLTRLEFWVATIARRANDVWGAFSFRHAFWFGLLLIWHAMSSGIARWTRHACSVGLLHGVARSDNLGYWFYMTRSDILDYCTRSGTLGHSGLLTLYGTLWAAWVTISLRLY